MGHVRTKIKLSNPRKPKLSPLEVTALVDTGAIHLCVPQSVVEQLRLEQLEQRKVTTADGRRQDFSYVGPVQISFANRNCYVGALVMGAEVLLGAVPLEDMDVLICPRTQTLTVNPNPKLRG